MKTKKIAAALSVLLAGSMTLGACSSGGQQETSSSAPSSSAPSSSAEPSASREANQLPISDEPVTQKFVSVRGPMNTVPYGEMPLLVDFEQKSNVKIEWEEIDNSAIQEKVNLMFSSNQLPDAFFGPLLTDAQVVTFSGIGSLVPLNGLIESDAPNVSKILGEREDYSKAITAPDGNIYALATLFEEERTLASDNLFINKAWLDKLGLAVPKTSDEFYQALKAFQEGDPNGNGKADEIPFSAVDKDQGDSLYSLFGMFGMPDNTSMSTAHLAVENGKVVYAAAQEGYKAAIAYFHKLYSEGLIDPEFFTQDKSQLKAKGNSDEEILGAVVCFWLDDVVAKEKQGDYVFVEPMKGPDGIQLWKRSLYMAGLTKNTFAITSANKNPEVAMRWADYWMDNGENAISMAQGQKDVLWGYEDDAGIKWRSWNEKVPEGMIYGQWRHGNCPGSNSLHFIQSDVTANRVLDEQNNAQNERYFAKKPYLMAQDNVLPPMYLNNDQQSVVSTVSNDIKTFTDQKRAEWITKGGVEEQWDEYLAQLDQYGLAQMLEAYQSAYDSFSK